MEVDLQENVTDDLPMPPLFQFLTVLAFKIFSSEKVGCLYRIAWYHLLSPPLPLSPKVAIFDEYFLLIMMND